MFVWFSAMHQGSLEYEFCSYPYSRNMIMKPLFEDTLCDSGQDSFKNNFKRLACRSVPSPSVKQIWENSPVRSFIELALASSVSFVFGREVVLCWRNHSASLCLDCGKQCLVLQNWSTGICSLNNSINYAAARKKPMFWPFLSLKNFCPCHMACRILVWQTQGLTQTFSSKSSGLNHWTTRKSLFLFNYSKISLIWACVSIEAIYEFPVGIIIPTCNTQVGSFCPPVCLWIGLPLCLPQQPQTLFVVACFLSPKSCPTFLWPHGL